MSEENLHAGHREKMRQKFLIQGFTLDTPEHEILEMLLFYAVPRKNTNEISHRLINKFRTLNGVFKASVEQLCTVEGISVSSAILIKLIPSISDVCLEKMQAQQELVFHNINEVGNYLLARYFGAVEERFGVLSLNGTGHFLSFDYVANGNVDSVGIATRDILEILIRTHANAVVLVHNHPSGIAIPSDSDVNATVGIQKVLSTIGVVLLDHIIISDNDYVSMASSKEFDYIF